MRGDAGTAVAVGGSALGAMTPSYPTVAARPDAAWIDPIPAARAVFPLGMYTVCTARLSRAVDTPYLMSAARGLIYVALAAWCFVAIAMFAHVARSLRRAGDHPP